MCKKYTRLVGHRFSVQLLWCKKYTECVKNTQNSGITETGTSDFGVKNTQKQTLYLNESGMYALIFTSKLPSAKAFKH
jgi:prophage antirepressor-like protein